jgi:hypothetical protein
MSNIHLQSDYRQHSVMKTSDTFSSFCLSLLSFPVELSERPAVLVTGFRMMSISCCNDSEDPDFEASFASASTRLWSSEMTLDSSVTKDWSREIAKSVAVSA